jgi:hypothetical protein
MKRALIILACLTIAVMLQAQVTKTVNVTAGGLSTALTTVEMSSITELIVTGTIDARDFKTMRDEMPLLKNVDLNDATIVEYTGTESCSKCSSILAY